MHGRGYTRQHNCEWMWEVWRNSWQEVAWKERGSEQTWGKKRQVGQSILILFILLCYSFDLNYSFTSMFSPHKSLMVPTCCKQLHPNSLTFIETIKPLFLFLFFIWTRPDLTLCGSWVILSLWFPLLSLFPLPLSLSPSLWLSLLDFLSTPISLSFSAGFIASCTDKVISGTWSSTKIGHRNLNFLLSK